jgi:uracil-DNA glycosylase
MDDPGMTDRIQPQRPVNFCGLALIGEAPGKDEIAAGFPFVGKAGKFLDVVMSGVGIERSRCLITNVFMERPEKNKIDTFFRVHNALDDSFINQYGLYRNRVVRPEHRDDMARLDAELVEYQPKLILLLGATALWRICRQSGITEARGKWNLTTLDGISHLVGILPTWHPSAVNRGRLDDTNPKFGQFVSDFKLVRDVLDGI